MNYIKSLTVLSLSLSSAFSFATLPNAQLEPVKKAAINKIDLNQADITVLTHSVKGIGYKKAQAIIAYRNEHQGFKSLEELAEVKGLGKNFVKAHQEDLNNTFTVSHSNG